MQDVIVTGASRGIGAALVRALAKASDERLVLVARDVERLGALAAELRAVRGDEASVVVVPGDLGTVASARALGQTLRSVVESGATLVHNAGQWPTRREHTPDGLERAFVVNHLGPLAMQAPLLDAGRIRRIMVVSAGLLIKGRFDAERTPWGRDFSSFRTYCTTKLCLAVEIQRVAREHRELDVVALHPGVVRTDLGARGGPLGWLLRLVKRSWEAPEACAERLVRVLGKERWSSPGEAAWVFEEEAQPWPDAAVDPATAHAVHECTQQLLEARVAATG